MDTPTAPAARTRKSDMLVATPSVHEVRIRQGKAGVRVMLRTIATGHSNGSNVPSSCPCGCRCTNHIHASIGNRVAPTGVVHHQGVEDQFWKLNRLDAKNPHKEGHWMDDIVRPRALAPSRPCAPR